MGSLLPVVNLSRKSSPQTARRFGVGTFAPLLGWKTIALVVLTISGVLGLLISPYPSVSLFRFGLFAIGVATYGVTLTWVRSARRFWIAFTGLAIVGALVATLGLLGSQFMAYRFTPLKAIVEFLPRLPDAWLRALGAAERIHPNEIGGVLILVLPSLIGMLLWTNFNVRESASGRLRSLTTPQVVFCVAAAELSIFYLILSVSRGVLAALGVALLWLLTQRNLRLGVSALLVCAVFMAGALTFLPPQFVGSLFFSDLTMPQWFAMPTRFAIWEQGIELWRASPWLGIGLGAFPYAFHDRVLNLPFYAATFVPHAHNLYLQAALDLGLVGAVSYVVLLAGAGLVAYRVGRQLGSGPTAGVAYGLAAGVLAFGLYGLLDTITVTSRAAPLVWFVIALATATRRLARPSLDPTTTSP